MALTRLSLLVLVLGLLAGCAGQARTGAARVGDVDSVDRTQSRQLAAQRRAEAQYDSVTPLTSATFQSNPPGATVEWYSRDGLWVNVGSTPSREVVIEGTGRPELFRFSMPGYQSQTRWVASTPNSKGVNVEVQLLRDLPADRFILGDSR